MGQIDGGGGTERVGAGTLVRGGAADGKRDPQTYAIIGAAMAVHRALGSSFLEGVYQAALGVEFDEVGVPYRREVALPIYYKNILLPVQYRSDFICFGEVLVELKALERLTPREDSQIINYLAASRLQRGLLLNFGAPSLEFKRFVGPERTPTTPSVQSAQSVGVSSAQSVGGSSAQSVGVQSVGGSP
jgi:GxxExxY protein